MEKDKKVTKRYVGMLTKIKKLLFGSRKRAIITVIVLIAIGFFAWQAYSNGNKQPQYQTAQAQKGTIISTVSESGNVAGISQAGVGSPTTGIITDIFVKDGDTVTAGQNLFKVKSTATAQEIASAWASYQNALNSSNNTANSKITSQASLEKDRASVIAASSAVTAMQNNLNTSQNNPATKMPYTQNDIDGINSALTSARETFSVDEQKYLQADQGIAASKASLNSSWLSYQATQDSDVTAPISGTVANIGVRVGDQIMASGGNLSSNLTNSSSTSTNAVMYIGDFISPYIKVQATEVDLPTIHAGQKATISLSAYSGKTFVGTVEQVDSVGAISSGVVTYNVFITFVAPSEDIKPGMSATVIIQTSRHDNVLSVPTSAVQTSQGQSTVRVLKNGQVTSVPVTTGISSDADTEITSGLTEGDTVVTGVVSTSQGSSSTGASPFGGGGFRGVGGFGGGGGGGARGGGARGG
jgi:RND family efflux transporter MFP subunit